MGFFAQRPYPPGAIRAYTSQYHTFGQDIIDLVTYDKVTATMLGMVSGDGDGTFAALMQTTPPNQGNDVEVVVGNCFVDEVPQVVIDEFTNFFD